MANPQKVANHDKEHGSSEGYLNFIEAVYKFDLQRMRNCVEANPACVRDTDIHRNNALHICIKAGAFRLRDIIEFLVTETDIDLLERNEESQWPLDTAIALGDSETVELLYERTLSEFDRRRPDPKAQLSPTPPKPKGP